MHFSLFHAIQFLILAKFVLFLFKNKISILILTFIFLFPKVWKWSHNLNVPFSKEKMCSLVFENNLFIEYKRRNFSAKISFIFFRLSLTISLMSLTIEKRLIHSFSAFLCIMTYLQIKIE